MPWLLSTAVPPFQGYKQKSREVQENSHATNYKLLKLQRTFRITFTLMDRDHNTVPVKLMLLPRSKSLESMLQILNEK